MSETRLPATLLPATVTRPVRDSLWLGLACLAGLALRLPLLARFPLREDEALYGFWALHFLYEDPYFLTVWPDKPPLFLWLLATVLAVVAPETPLQAEAAARWLNIAISVLTIPVAASVARRWWGSRAGWMAGLAMAFNPFVIAFGPTAYTDPLLVLAGMLALAGAVYSRWMWAGVWLGAAIMTKQQGLFYIPLLLGLWWQASLPNHKRAGQMLAYLLGGAALVLLPVIYWDSLRWAVAPSPWDLAPRTYSPIAPAAIEQWGNRTREWVQVGWYLAGAWWVWWLLAVGLGAMATRRAIRRSGAGTMRLTSGPVWLAVWAAGFVAVHVLSTLQVWDRYWLPLAPLVALAIGRVAAIPGGGSWQSTANPARLIHRLMPLLLCGLLIWPGWQAAQGRFPIGSDHGDYAGLHEAMRWLHDHAGPRYLLYHQTLGWHYLFYYYTERQRGQVETRWFGGPAALADNAAKTPYPPAYLILPDWSPQPQAAIHLATRGLVWTPRFHTGRMRVVEIVHLPGLACDWCTCRLHPEAVGRPDASWHLAHLAPAGMMSEP